MASNVETSVFIRTNGDLSYPRASISGRPLLRSSTSTGSTTKSTHSMICNQHLKKYGITSIILIIVIIAVILAVVLVAKGSTDSDPSKETTFQTACHHHRNSDIRGTDTSHDAFRHRECSNELKTMKGCGVAKANDWVIVDRNSSDFEELKDLLPISHIDFESLLISPLYRSPKNGGHIYVSFAMPSNSPIEVYVDLPVQELLISINMTSDLCRHGIISDPQILSQSVKFRLIVFSKDILTVDDVIRSAVTSHARASFEDITSFAEKPTHNPTFPTVPIGTRDLCSSEIFNNEVHCDWKIVRHRSSKMHFALQETHDCIPKGVSIQNNDFVWFLGLPAKSHSTSEAYLISPIIERSSSHFLLSFWYMPHCNGTTIRAYVVPSYDAIQSGISEHKRLVYEIHHNDSVRNWIFTFNPIEIPASYKTFQILLEGKCTDTTCSPEKEDIERFNISTQCANLLCRKTRNFQSILGVDNLAVETRYDQCVINNETVTNLNCSFEKEDGSATICLWNSTERRRPPWLRHRPKKPFNLLHWQPRSNDTYIFDEPNHGANREHLVGRGHVLHFDASGKFSVYNYFRSPLLIGNTNCSCVMTFDYLLRGTFAPRLHVNLVLGSNLKAENRPSIPQWSVYGHQSNDWLEASVLLNLRTEPFQIEIQLLDGEDSQGDVEIDDLYFTECNFQIYE